MSLSSQASHARRTISRLRSGTRAVSRTRVPERSPPGTVAQCTEVASKYLATYLNDHLAGSTGGIELVRRAAGEYEGTELGEFLSGLAREIEEDRETLKEYLAELGVDEDRLKVAAGWAGEKLGRLKPNGHLMSRSPLSALVEFEALSLGVEGKRRAGVAVRDARDGDPSGPSAWTS